MTLWISASLLSGITLVIPFSSQSRSGRFQKRWIRRL